MSKTKKPSRACRRAAPPCSACCYAPLRVAGTREGTRWYECTKCGKHTDPSDKYWCAFCGKWGDHQSGWCPELAHFDQPNTCDNAMVVNLNYTENEAEINAQARTCVAAMKLKKNTSLIALNIVDAPGKYALLIWGIK